MKDWIQKHRIIWIFIVVIAINMVGGIIGSSIPALDPLIQLVWWVVLFFGLPYTLYSEYKHRYPIQANSQPIQPTQTTAPGIQVAVPVPTNNYRTLEMLLALQYSVLVVYGIVFAMNGFSADGEGWILFWVYGLTLFLPTLVAFILFSYRYIKETSKNWKNLESYSKSGFFLFWVQLILFIMVFNSLPN
jgi:hypothetical protein